MLQWGSLSRNDFKSQRGAKKKCSKTNFHHQFRSGALVVEELAEVCCMHGAAAAAIPTQQRALGQSCVSWRARQFFPQRAEPFPSSQKPNYALVRLRSFDAAAQVWTNTLHDTPYLLYYLSQSSKWTHFASTA